MATDIGNVYLDVYADTKLLKKQIKAAAKQAGKDFGKDFGAEAEKSMAPSLSRLGKQISDQMEDNGRLSGRQFVDGVEDEVRDLNLGFDRAIQRAAADQNWEPLLKNFDTMEEDAARIKARLSEWRDEIGGTGANFDQITADLDGYIREIQLGDQAIADLNKQQDEAKAKSRAFADEQARLAKVLKDTNDAEKLLNAELKRRAMNEASADAQRLSNETENLNVSLRRATTELKEFAKTDAGKQQSGSIRNLMDEYERLRNRIRLTGQNHKVALKGMSDDVEGYHAEVTRVRALIARFDTDLKGLGDKRQEFKADVDLPSSASIRAKALLLGRAFKSAFNKGSKSGGSGTPDFIQTLSSRWNEFLTAFSASITVLLRYFVILGPPVLSLASAIGGVLTAAIGSVGVAAVGAAGALAGIGAAAGLAALLAVKAFKQLQTESPKAKAAIDGLKDSFTNVAVGEFAKEWEASLIHFSNTAADVFRFSGLGAALGKATAQITNAFTAVLQSPAFTGFVDAIKGPLSTALANVGTALADVFSVLLSFMTAAAPLAVHLSEQFKGWAANLKAATDADTGGLAEFFDKARAALDVIVPLVGDLSAALGNVFLAGSTTGTSLLTTLAGLASKFREWTTSVQGNEALTEWFSGAEGVFNSLLSLLGELGKTLAGVVTPESTSDLQGFFALMEEALPLLGEVLKSIGQAGTLTIIGNLLIGILNALQPLLPLLQTFADIIANLDPALIQAVGTALFYIIGGLKVIGVLSTALEVLGFAFAFIAGVIEVVTTAWELLGLAFAANPIGFIITVVALLVVALVLFFTKTETGRKIVAAAWEGIKTAVKAVGDWFTGTLVPALSAAWDAITAGVQTVGDFFGDVWQGILDAPQNVVNWFKGTFVPFMQNLPNLLLQGLLLYIEFWVSLPGRIIGALASLLSLLITWGTNITVALIGWVTEMIPKIVQFFIALPGNILSAITSFGAMLLGWITSAWDAVTTFIVGAFIAYVDFWVQLPGRIVAAVKTLGPLLGSFFSGVWDTVKSNATTAWDTFIGFISGIPGRAIAALTSFGSQIAGAVRKGLGEGNTAALEGVGNVVATVGKIPGKIITALGNLGSTLYSAGKDIIDGFLRGLKASWESVKTWVGGLGSWIADHKGPRSVDLQLLAPAGGWIMEGLRKGLIDALPALRKTLGTVTDAINVGGAASLGVNTSGAGSNVNPPGGGNVGATVASGAIQIITPVKDPAIVASMVLDGIVGRL